jgi:hypothetical protein
LKKRIDDIIGRMKEYIVKDFSQPPPKRKGFKDHYASDLEDVKTLPKKNQNDVANLIKRIDKRVASKNRAMKDIDELHPEGSCFKKYADLIQESFELDERAQKTLMHQYVQSVKQTK